MWSKDDSKVSGTVSRECSTQLSKHMSVLGRGWGGLKQCK